MLKKILIRSWRAVVCICLLVIILDVFLHVISRTEWFKIRVIQAIQTTVGRDIKLARMGVNLRGIFIKDFAMAEQGGFENGTFVQAGRLQVHVSLLHLLHGHTKVDLIALSDAVVQVRVSSDGSASWQDLISSGTASEETQPTTGTFPLRVTASHIRLENTQLIYTDLTGPHAVHVDGLTVGVNQFSLSEPFSFYVQANITPAIQEKKFSIPFVLRGKADLKGLDLRNAFVDIRALSISYNKAALIIKGRVENLESPQVNLQATLHHVSSEQLADVVSLPPFQLDKAKMALKGAVDLDKSAVTLHALTLQAPGVELKAKGGLLYGKPELIYEAEVKGEVVLGEAGRWFTALADSYHLVGSMSASAQITQQQVSGTLQLDEAGALIAQTTRLSNINARINFQETLDFKTGKTEASLVGKVNGHPAEISLQVVQRPEIVDGSLRIKAEEIALPAALFESTEEAAEPAEPQTQPAPAWPLPPIKVKADVEIGKLDVPYFYGENVAFKADIEGITPDLKQAHGSVQLSTGNGKIQDLYKLTNANPLTKVLFLSLNITGKVFDSLNVFDVLGSIGGGISSAVTGGDQEETQVYTQTILGPDGEPMEVEVVPTHKKVEGELAYDKFDTTVNFVKGRATVKKGTFVSSMMSFRLDGTTDFNTQQVDLTVHAAPGRHEVDGMLPLTLTIDGTVDNPKGSMALLGSVTSLVTQSVTNNVVSRQVGKGVKGIFNLFKKKPAEETEELPSQSNSEQEPEDSRETSLN